MPPLLILALVSQAETRVWTAGRAMRLRKLKMSDANSRPPDVETAIKDAQVVAGVGFFGKRIMRVANVARAKVCVPARMAEAAPPCASRGRFTSE